MTAPADHGLPEPVPRDGGTSLPAPSIPHSLRGHYAGFASRFIAFIADCVVSIAVFELVLAAASFAASVLTGSSIHWNRGNVGVVIAFFVWQFLYYGYFWTGSGKTPGMQLLGVQVVGQDGSNVGPRRGLVRTLAFPLSFLLLGLGFLGILLGRDRRALHDSIAGTAVVYTWSAREARIRFLARERSGHRPPAGSAPPSPAPQLGFRTAGMSTAAADGAASPPTATSAQRGTPDAAAAAGVPDAADRLRSANRPHYGVDRNLRAAVQLDGPMHPFGPQDAQPGQLGADRLWRVQDAWILRPASTLGEVSQIMAYDEQCASRSKRGSGTTQHLGP